MLREALHASKADLASELNPNAVTQFSSGQEMPSVYLSKNWLFRETSRVLTT